MWTQVNGKDYTVDHSARKCKILDKYARPRESAYELWLEMLNHSTFGTPLRYLSPQFLLSRPYVLKKHERIVGLSGSLGNTAEQAFVQAVYDCELVLVPPFLDCCHGKRKERPACRGVFVEETPEAHMAQVRMPVVSQVFGFVPRLDRLSVPQRVHPPECKKISTTV